MSTPLYHTRLQQCRESLQALGVGGMILPVNDEFFSEYPPEHFKRLHWLTGFTGSAGTVVVLADKAAFFTDGRYTLQAADEVDGGDYTIHNSRDLTPLAWLSQEASGRTIGFDPWLISVQQMNAWKKQSDVTWKALANNPIDDLWRDRTSLSTAAAFAYPDALAGRSAAEKVGDVTTALQAARCDAALLTLPESICWLLNIRARDVAHTPLLLSRALVASDGDVALFAPAEKIPETVRTNWRGLVELYTPESLPTVCATLAGKRILIAPEATPVALHHALEQTGAEIVFGKDPCQLPKACKNVVEQTSIREVHRRDGAALTAFLHWVDGQSELDEIRAAEKLDAMRARTEEFIEPSFPTISGFGANGAIVHYRATEASNATFHPGSLYLVDSGGQYFGGTTDVTRTIAIGEPTAEMRDCYTRVLKGHIALASTIFPPGTTGSQLDILARQFLWEAGLDYDHGTGHGVGCCLGVHEGPQRISKAGNDQSLLEGMILSNEPGYYKTGEFGIRIENLVMVVPAARQWPQVSVQSSEFSVQEGWLAFETLTRVPYDERLIDIASLTDGERQWLADYAAGMSDL